MKSKPKSGEWLEYEVQRIYDLLGAKTDRRILIKNYEIDVLARFQHGPIEMSVIIECKEYGPKKPIPDSDMRSFIVKLLAARELGRADKGIFVTTSGYTKTAKQTASQYGIQCLTLAELINKLVEFGPYIKAIRAEFQRSALATYYVEQTGSDIEDYEIIANDSRSRILHKPLTSYVDEIFSAGVKRLALLGNFGSGKTSFCSKYRDVLLERHIKDPLNRIPVLLNLRYFRSDIDIQGSLCNYLQAFLGNQLSLPLFIELQRMGRFIFLLDGLDEMAARVDRVVIHENLRELDRLVAGGDNLYLVTCRTHFFQEKITDEFLQDYRVVYLTEWGLSDLSEYIEKLLPHNWQSTLNRIRTIPQLVDLSRTPLLVEMLVSSLNELPPSDSLNLGMLYQAYTGRWINRESQRRGAVMSASQRLHFAKKLSAILYGRTVSAAHYSELYEIARDFSGYRDASKLDYFDTDVRTCTFITKDSAGNYSFRHRSFLEYFCTQSILDEIRARKFELLSGRTISAELMAFLGPASLKEDDFAVLQEWSARFSERILARNAAAILLWYRRNIKEEVASKLELEAQLQLSSVQPGAVEDYILQKQHFIRAIVVKTAYRWDKSGSLIDDLVQQVFMRLFSKIETVKARSMEIGQIDVYLKVVAANTVHDYFRAKKGHGAESLDAFEVVDPTSMNFVREVEIRELNEIMSSIETSDRTREIFQKYFIEGYTAREIGERLGLNTKTVESILYGVVKRLRHSLSENVEN